MFVSALDSYGLGFFGLTSLLIQRRNRFSPGCDTWAGLDKVILLGRVLRQVIERALTKRNPILILPRPIDDDASVRMSGVLKHFDEHGRVWRRRYLCTVGN